MKLSRAQQRILDQARKGSHTYAGQARPAIEELERRGLVNVVWDKRQQVKGNSLSQAWSITVTLKESAACNEGA